MIPDARVNVRRLPNFGPETGPRRLDTMFLPAAACRLVGFLFFAETLAAYRPIANIAFAPTLALRLALRAGFFFAIGIGPVSRILNKVYRPTSAYDKARTNPGRGKGGYRSDFEMSSGSG